MYISILFQIEIVSKKILLKRIVNIKVSRNRIVHLRKACDILAEYFKKKFNYHSLLCVSIVYINIFFKQTKTIYSLLLFQSLFYYFFI